MQPTSDNGPMRVLAGCGGFVAGIGAQMLLQVLINSVVGPIHGFWSRETLLLVAILLAPPVLSYMFLTVEIGSPGESFVKGLQLGALFWFIKVLVTVFL